MSEKLFKHLEMEAVGNAVSLPEVLSAIQFGRDGLVPAVAQQHDSREVLMLAWMDRQSISETLETGRVCYWSRSRQAYWRKGETSGNIQRLVEMRIDCDGDALLLRVDQHGSACHTERRSCFYLSVQGDEVKILTQAATSSS